MTRKERERRIMEGAAVWAGYYRCNPHRFAKDYLHLDLHVFQKILLVMMFWCNTFVFIAARGLGKSYLSAIFCVIRCILYPGTKIVIASGSRGQSINVLEKIVLEIKPNSPELANEINEKETRVNTIAAQIVFKNTSYIKVVTANDKARSNRANIVLVDEFRMVSKDVIDTVLRKFLSNPRIPNFMKLPEYKNKKEYREPNKTFYLSSAYFKDHWSYDRTVDKCKSMIGDTTKSFVCALPYQLALECGLMMEEGVIDQMSESDFSEIKWGMEMECRWFGDEEGSFFDFASLAKNRRMRLPMLPDALTSKLANPGKVKIAPKMPGEKRILSADIALMSSKKGHANDASAIFINQMLPNKAGRYSSNIIYCDAAEGLHTEDQALMIRRLYEEYDCDYIVVDTVGVGLGVFDSLVRDMTDPNTGEIYPALSCCNNQEMAERCTVPGAEKVIWSIKGNKDLNSECAIMLREGFRSGKIRLLVNEYDAEKILGEIKGYTSLSEEDKLRFQMPYIHTTLLINELVNLQHDESGGKVRVFEKKNMRKDRYSSLSYNFYVANQLEIKLSRKSDILSSSSEFCFKAPKIKKRMGGESVGRKR